MVDLEEKIESKPKRFKKENHSDSSNDLRKEDLLDLKSSNLFKLELIELLKEISLPKEKEQDLNHKIIQLIKNLKGLKPKADLKINDLDLFEKNNLIVPVVSDLCKKSEGTYSFVPPENIQLIGSFSTKTFVNNSIKKSIDLSVEIPADYFNERDYLNYRYFSKRNIYLAHVYLQLSKLKNYSQSKFEFNSNYSSFFKPILSMSLNALAYSISSSDLRVGRCFFLTSYRCFIIKKNDVLIMGTYCKSCGHREVEDQNIKGSIGSIHKNYSFNVCLHFIPSSESFKLHRFNPNQNNVRPEWFFEKFKSESINLEEKTKTSHPNPFYNYEILNDLRMNENNRFLKETLNSRGVIEAIQLLKLWSYKRELNKGYGAFTGFIAEMFVSYLLLTEKINSIMNQYQIFKTLMVNLSEAKWNQKGINMRDVIDKNKTNETNGSLIKDNELKLEDFHKYYEIVFLDPSGYLNICSKMSLSTFLAVKHEASICLKLLNDQFFDCFDQLFIRNHSIEINFDALVKIDPLDDKSFYNKIVASSSSQLNLMEFYNNDYCVSLKPIQDLLFKALDQRTSLIYIQIAQDLKWSLNSKPPTQSTSILIGLIFKDGYENILIKGPISTLPEAAEFRKFWGQKSELRRFHDTTICETALFEASDISKKRLVYADILKYVLKLHLSIKDVNLNFCDRQFDQLLSIPSGIFNNYGTGEEKLADVVNVFNEFTRIIKNLKELPLLINNISGISSAFRLTDVFAPLPCYFNYDQSSEKNMRYKHFNKYLPKYPLGPVTIPYVKPLNVTCQLESSGKWPDDIECIKRLKSAFYLKIVHLLREAQGLLCMAFLDHCDIVYKGFVFRLIVCTSSELFCIKSSLNDQGIILTIDSNESRNYEKQMNHIPKINSVLYGLQQKFNSYTGVCRIVKRWMSSQFLIDYFEEEAIDLICSYLFVHSNGYEPPKSIITGLLRFFDLITNFDWKNQPLFINFNNEFQKDETSKIQSKFQETRNEYPPLCIVTPYDNEKYSLWTQEKPNIQQLCRVILLAKQSSNFLKKFILNFDSTESFKRIFRPNTNIYDVVINLKPSYCTKAYQKIDLAPGTFLPRYRDNNNNNELDKESVFPVVDFDPVELYVNALRQAYDELALFSYDTYGDTNIYVIWKPDALKSKKLDKSNLKYRQLDPISNDLNLNIEVIFEDFKLLGNELVENLTINNKNFKFE